MYCVVNVAQVVKHKSDLILMSYSGGKRLKRQSFILESLPERDTLDHRI